MAGLNVRPATGTTGGQLPPALAPKGGPVGRGPTTGGGAPGAASEVIPYRPATGSSLALLQDVAFQADQHAAAYMNENPLVYGLLLWALLGLIVLQVIRVARLRYFS